MPGLSRRTGGLLRTVNGKPHASDDDHEMENTCVKAGDSGKRRSSRRAVEEKCIPTPPATNSTVSSQVHAITIDEEEEEDFGRDPVSSDDSPRDVRESFGSAGSDLALDGMSGAKGKSKNGKGFKMPAALELGKGKEKGKGPNALKLPPGLPEKRKSPSPEFMAEYARALKKPKREHKPQTNIHAPAPPPKRSSQQATYGKSSKPKPQAEKAFKAYDIGEREPKSENQAPKSPKTRKLKDVEVPIRKDAHENMEQKQRSSSPLSDHDDDEFEDKADMCTFCSTSGLKSMKEDFEDDFLKGKDWSYTWQRRFCKYHKEKEARITWDERSYPTIDWSGLERRMRKHDTFLISVLNNKRPSHYRESLAKKVKPGAKGSSKQLFANEDSKPGASVGYYGPKGEKMMSDHIINCLSDDIRQRAAKDKLVASSGVQGGVTGFVQAVLVPHLAELLIKEDMGLGGDWSTKAQSIIAESCDVGEIIHPEVEDRIAEVADDDDDD